MSINTVILIGNLGKDPELAYGTSGIAICRFSLATNEIFKNKAGEVQKRTEWHSVVCFGNLAETCSRYLVKGRQVYIQGSIRTRKWEDEEGKEHKTYDIVASHMRMLSSANGTGAKPKEMAPSQNESESIDQNCLGQAAVGEDISL